MKQYHDLLNHILETGTDKEDRTGTGTRSIFGYQMRFDLAEGFPLLTTKKVHLKSIIHELLWFISGRTDVKYLQERGVSIWDEWATEEQCARFGRPAGDLGPIYGHQWRNFGGTLYPAVSYGGQKLGPYYAKDGVDQLRWLMDEIRRNPNSRRLIVSGWNPAEVDQVALPPCHTLFQLYVANGKVSCQLYQRSADVFLGVPFNIASYALLTMMIAKVTGYEPGEFIHTLGDAHIYANHFRQVREQLSREPRPLPRMILNTHGVECLDDFRYEHFNLIDYDPHPAIKAPVAV